MKKFFAILVLVLIFALIFGELAFYAENRLGAESSRMVLLTDLETECKYLVPSSSQSYVHPAGKPYCWRNQ